MSAEWPGGDGAREAYEAFAPVYDDFNRGYGYMYERWTGVLLEKAEEAGMGGKQLLDVACGTGLSFISMPGRGWRVTGCDISPAMIELARAKAGDDVSLHVADMRELPDLGLFDLIWVVNGPINYLLSTGELKAALKGMSRNLAAGGIVLFDVNTLATYRGFFSEEWIVEERGRRLVWRGQASPEKFTPGSVCEARFEAMDEPGSERVHKLRHFQKHEVLAAIEAAGLICVASYGEREGDLYPSLDEETYTKAVYLCRAQDGDG